MALGRCDLSGSCIWGMPQLKKTCSKRIPHLRRCVPSLPCRGPCQSIVRTCRSLRRGAATRPATGAGHRVQRHRLRSCCRRCGRAALGYHFGPRPCPRRFRRVAGSGRRFGASELTQRWRRPSINQSYLPIYQIHVSIKSGICRTCKAFRILNIL